MSGDVGLVVMRKFLAAVVGLASVIHQSWRCVNDPNKVNSPQLMVRQQRARISLWLKWRDVARASQMGLRIPAAVSKRNKQQKSPRHLQAGYIERKKTSHFLITATNEARYDRCLPRALFSGFYGESKTFRCDFPAPAIKCRYC